ncbi:MAG: hypothetical protein LPK45_06030, partial [Bacteroidota bacterium]|nr:hypothetical protein [Bacteroidota bacterium]MDX5430627.1 hypothetical protein [Bacteroidota bacterium]MDX5469377.1 hypothetical protein [Bacteroidota bacterium]
MKRLLLVLTMGLSLTHFTQAQDLNCAPDDLADMFKRQLIVEFADTLEAGRGQITKYPQKNLGYLLKSAVEEYWKVNAKIEYQVQGDIKRNLEKGEARNVYLFLTKHPDSKPGSTIWILNYSKGTSYKEGKIDYQIYLPDISKRSVAEFTAFDVEFTVSVMQEHMKYVQKNNKKISPAEYFYIEAEKNCKLLKSANPNVFVDQGYLSKSVDEKGLKKAFKKVRYTLLTSEQINSALEESKDSAAIIINYPGKFESLSTSAMGEKYIFWNKVLVQGSSYKVLGAVGNGRKDNVLIDIES